MKTATTLLVPFLMTSSFSESSIAEVPAIDEQIQQELAWVENGDQIRQIEELAKSGNPKIRFNAKECGVPFVDLVGEEADSRLCLKWMNLPDQLTSDLIVNNEKRFANESDYDQRITKFYAFEHDGALNRELSEAEIEVLFKTFNAGISFGTKYSKYHRQFATAEDVNYLTSLSGLFVGLAFQDQTEAFLYAMELFQGAAVKSIAALYEVGLYPGGGFTTKFELLISDRHLIFVKTEGWNS